MMNHMRKHAVMIFAAFVVAAAGYMAYQRYQARHEAVEVQFLNFGGNYDGDSSYEAGYRDGVRDASKEVVIQHSTNGPGPY